MASKVDNSLPEDEVEKTKPVDQNARSSESNLSKALNVVATPSGAPLDGQTTPGRDVEASLSVDEPQRLRSRTALTMAALMIAVFLAALDQTIITTALPTIAKDFQASEADYTWIGSTYLLAGAAAMPSWGKISDVFGRKPIILLANAIFFVGSLICALSINIKMLQAGRVVQGIGAGGLMTLVNICISDMFSMRTRGMYFGIIGMVWAFASGVGPILGGVFTDLVTWKWCFYINLPLDGAALLILFLFLDIETPKTPIIAGLKALDWIGSLLIVGGTITLLLGLEFGGVYFPWNSATVICLIVFGAGIIGLFFVVEWKFAKYPLMPLRLFNKASNVAAMLTNFLHGVVFISGSYFLPLYFQAVLGATPLLSGVYLLPFALSLSFFATASGIFIRNTGQYLPPIWFGLSFMTLGFGLYIDFPIYPSWSRVVLFQIIAGVGVGSLFQSPLIALQTHVAQSDVAAATATIGFLRFLSTACSVVIGGVIFQNEMAKRIAALGSTLSPAVAKALSGGSVGSSTGIVSGLPSSEKAPVLAAYNGSLRVLWIFYTAVAFAGLLVSLKIAKSKLQESHEVTKTGLDVQEKDRLARIVEKLEKSGSKAVLEQKQAEKV